MQVTVEITRVSLYIYCLSSPSQIVNIHKAHKTKDLIAKQCTPFCGSDCPFQDKHHYLIVSLLGLQDSKASSLGNWKAFILHEVDEGVDLNQPILDPDPDLRYPLLSWAAVLGKVKAVKWLLQQDFINLTENEGDSPPKLNVSNATALFSAVRNLHEFERERPMKLPSSSLTCWMLL